MSKTLAKRTWGLAGIAGIAAIALIWDYSRAPVLWSALLWSCFLFAYCVYGQSDLLRVLSLSLALAGATVGGFELQLWLRGTHIEVTKHQDPPHNIADSILGVRPPSDTKVRVRAVRGEEQVYETVYTIGADGLRVTRPPIRIADSPLCDVFFGGSFVYGEGIADHETLPSLVAQSGIPAQNFGFSGYGPNHVLAMLEDGRVEGKLACVPSHVIYVAIPDHVRRVAGRTSWRSRGPKYEVANGVLRRNGLIGVGSASFIGARLQKSLLFRKIARRWQERIKEEDIDLFLQVVEAIQIQVARDYAGAKFLVVYWDVGRGRHVEMIRKGLASVAQDVFLVSEIIPEFEDFPERFVIGPYDSHPGPVANKRIAVFLVSLQKAGN